MTEPVELKPCPFCGAKRITVRETFRETFVVYCENCHCSTPYGMSKQYLIELWNRRAEVKDDE
ncbi:MAG: Lar family restriction alleviation protein [Pyramidobacter sp.]|nr:Lar family restriction alleviation protein [Pyramidobacter sp.]